MDRLGETVLDIVGLTDHVEAHLSGESGISIAWLVGKLDALVGQDGMDAIGQSWRSRDVPVPYGFLPFQRKDRPIKP